MCKVKNIIDGVSHDGKSWIIKLFCLNALCKHTDCHISLNIIIMLDVHLDIHISKFGFLMQLQWNQTQLWSSFNEQARWKTQINYLLCTWQSRRRMLRGEKPNWNSNFAEKWMYIKFYCSKMKYLLKINLLYLTRVFM